MTQSNAKGMRREFVSFLVTGGIAALVNLGARLVFNLVMPFEIAVIVAYLFGMTTAYVLARNFVFERSGRAVHDEYLRFTLVNLVAVSSGLDRQCRPCGLCFPTAGFCLAFLYGRACYRCRDPGLHELYRPQAAFVRVQGQVKPLEAYGFLWNRNQALAC